MKEEQKFLKAIQDSFNAFIASGSSRSTAKLKPLHGYIAQEIANRLGDDYIIKSHGYGDDKEYKAEGKYMDKDVDISILNKHTQEFVTGIAVKFVMQNYKQNSYNYFEGMLGETSNIRSNNKPYYQIFIILDKLPYYKNDEENGKIISKWEKLTPHNMKKYIKLSYDNVDSNLHVPNNTLIYVVHINDEADEQTINTQKKYLEYYKTNIPSVELSKNEYPEFNPNGSVIYNNFEKFMDKVYQAVV
jgi:hypothetical protein